MRVRLQEEQLTLLHFKSIQVCESTRPSHLRKSFERNRIIFKLLIIIQLGQAGYPHLKTYVYERCMSFPCRPVWSDGYFNTFTCRFGACGCVISVSPLCHFVHRTQWLSPPFIYRWLALRAPPSYDPLITRPAGCS